MWGIRKWGMILENTKNTKNVFKMFLFHIHKKHAQMMVIGMAWMELNLRKPCPKLKNIQNTLRKQGFLTFFEKNYKCWIKCKLSKSQIKWTGLT